MLTVFLSLVVACGLGYALGQRCPQPACSCSCRCRTAAPRMSGACDCDECECESGGHCLRPGRCPNVHGLPRPSIN